MVTKAISCRRNASSGPHALEPTLERPTLIPEMEVKNMTFALFLDSRQRLW